jgi:membrane protease YdiL (CAAX protease family)
MEWVIVVALVLGVPLSLWIYTRAFRRVYFVQDERILVTQYSRLDAAIAFVVALYLLSPLLLASSSGKTADPIRMDAQVMLVGYFLYYGTLLLLIVASLVLRHINLGEVFRFDKTLGLQAVRRGFVFLMYAAPLVFVAGFFVNWWLDAKQDQQDVITLFEQSKSAAQRIPLFLAAVIAAPVAEELVFRGYLYSVVKRFLGGIPALVLTGIVFAVIHANIPSLLPLFLFACCLTLAYETTGSLWVSMTMHAAFNAVNLVISLSQFQSV